MGKSKRRDTVSERSDRDTIQNLKAIIRAQRKEIGQLRRELNKREDVSEDYRELLNEEETRQTLSKEIKQSISCQKCGHEADEVAIGKFTLQRCTSPTCNWRKRIEKAKAKS